jgi:hypothetical protein
MEKPPPDIVEDLTFVEAPDPFRVWLWVGIALFLLLAAGAMAWHFYRQKKLPFLFPPPDPPDAIALRELAAIRPMMDDESRGRDFVIAVSKILRTYIEGKFQLRAPKRSTEEFLVEAERSEKLNVHERNQVAAFLSECDRVKFARRRAMRERMKALHDSAHGFVIDTRNPRLPEKVKPAVAAANEKAPA